jgi:hypothetical protein
LFCAAYWQPKEKCRTRASVHIALNQAEQNQHLQRKLFALSLPVMETAEPGFAYYQGSLEALGYLSRWKFDP